MEWFKLTEKVYAGRLASKYLIGKILDDDTYDNLQRAITEGIQSEETVVTYTDTLITAWNPRETQHERAVPDPHPCSVSIDDFNKEESDKYYEDLINCVQRHTCRPSGYCKSNKQSMNGQCRFGYPFEKNNKTVINFIETENSVKAEIVLKRNDSQMNGHNRIFEEFWQANTDCKIIIDISLCLAYIVKYITKGK